MVLLHIRICGCTASTSFSNFSFKVIATSSESHEIRSDNFGSNLCGPIKIVFQDVAFESRKVKIINFNFYSNTHLNFIAFGHHVRKRRSSRIKSSSTFNIYVRLIRRSDTTEAMK